MDDSGRYPKNKQLSMFDPVEIPLTKGYVTVVDPIDADLMKYRWGAYEGPTKVYAARNRKIRRKQTTIYLHRVILSRILGRELLLGEKGDHRDGSSLNNRRENLRLASSTQNNRNRKGKGNHLKGVKPEGKYWFARIVIAKRDISLGSYNTEEDAGIAYNHAAQEHFGEFAVFNDIPGWQDTHPVRRLRKDVVTRKPGKSGHRNIQLLPESGRYRVSFKADRKFIHVGMFDTIEEALEARDKARAEHHDGEDNKHERTP